MRNKYVILLVCAGAAVTLLGSCRHRSVGNEALFHELDECIAHRQEYRQERELKIDSLRGEPAEDFAGGYFEKCGRLLEAYRSYDLDSQLYYTRERLRSAVTPFENQAALLNYGEVMMRNAMYHEAILYLDSAGRTPIDEALKPYYFHLRRTLYGLMEDFSVAQPEREKYALLTRQYRDSMMAIHPPGSFLHELVRADGLYAQCLYDSALQVMDRYAGAHLVSGQDEEAVFAVTRAQIYRALGDREQEKKYLAVSSLADLRNSIREYISLRELAILLYREGDVDRAYRYMHCAIEDATAGSARVRSIETGIIYPVIESAYQKQVHRRQMALSALLVSILVIVLLLVAVVLYFNHQRRKLASLNARLEASNDKLRLSNQINTMYIGRYMETASLLIDRFDAWRKNLKTLAHDRQYDKITSILSSQRFTQEQLDAFYHDFDEAFLQLFPHFISDVQALLQPGNELRIKEGERLNTDLRVLALIRLGITDSRQIADFLRYSLSTIYNSRTRMRNLYQGNREEFEAKIATL